MSDINDKSQRLQYIFKYSTDNSILPILWINEDGLILYHNESVYNYLGNNDLSNTFIYRISSDIKKEDWDNLWNKLKIDKKSKFTQVYYNKSIDKVFTFNVLTSLVEYDSVYYCYMVIVDITELIETNFRLSKEKSRAEESERLKNAFLSNISHEIRTPMNAIVGFSEILNDNIDEHLKDYTKIIVENIDYLLSLIDNIIMISRIDSEQISIRNNNFDIMEILNDFYIIYSLKLKNNSKNIKIVIDNNTSQLIETDKYIVEECLHRLIDNSIKFSVNNGIIHIGYYTQENNITIYVKDNGVGIENKYQEIIFDRFRQVNKQTIGSGLGLSIFKSFVKLLNGKYNLTSKTNEGTLVSFTLKLKSDNNYNELRCVDSFDLDTDKLKGKRILVAEDLEVNQLLIHDMLLPYNVNIVKCMDGRECIDKFLEIKDIDLILMDLDMPYMDGYEATKIIRQTDKVIPIIAQTAYSQKENRERARKIGFNDFIIKPLTRDCLLKIIIKYL